MMFLMERLINEITQPRPAGIKFMCKKHYWLSMRNPCPKCCEEHNIQRPTPLPKSDSKEEFNNLFDGKVIGGDLDEQS